MPCTGEGAMLCDDRCVDTRSDPDHCGGCGVACASPRECVASACTDPVVDLAAGAFNTCAVRATGSLQCWGGNDRGQLGDGTTTSSNVPVTPVGLPAIARVDVGGQSSGGYGAHACAVASDGSVWCWGRNDSGQLGSGDLVDALVPTRVIEELDAIDVAVGEDHSCALLRDGAVRCWGGNVRGQLGNGSSVDHSTTSVPVPVWHVVQIDATASHTCAVTSEGFAWCWGSNAHGQIGAGDTAPTRSPEMVATVSLAAEVVAGRLHSCLRARDGGVQCWGFGLLIGNGTSDGDAHPLPEDVPLASATQLSASFFGTCARLTDQTARCWGRDYAGSVLAGAQDITMEPHTIAALGSVRRIEAGDRHGCAVADSGALLCWGDHSYGQLGIGDGPATPEPTRVVGY